MKQGIHKEALSIPDMHIPGEKGRSIYPLPGPGLLIALASSGWVGLLSLITFGADSGYAFVGITLITLFFKYAMITGIGRFTIVTGRDIFTGLSQVPGPKNWAIWMVNGVLYLEIFMLGFSSITMVRFLNEFSGISVPSVIVIFLIFGIIFILVSLDSYSFFRNILLRCIVFIILGFGTIVYSNSIPLADIFAGIIPNMNSYFSIYETAIILTSVGSGFSLLFLSPWILSHVKRELSEAEKPLVYRRIQADVFMGVVMLIILSLIYFSVGFFFLFEHGLGAPESDLTLGIIFVVMNLGNYGSVIFALVCLTILFCSLFGGLYGRARVFEITLPRIIPELSITRKRFQVIVGVLILSALFADFYWNQALFREFIAIRLLLFSLLTSLLMLIDFRLGSEKRGSIAWYGLMSVGVAFSFYIGINLFILYL